MRHITVMNAKGGCGKTTLATSLAAYYADEGASVVLADYDPQGSASDWLALRPEDRAPITGVKAHENGLRGVNRGTDLVVLDAPARSHGPELTDLLNHTETIVMPVLPSTIDMMATTRFIKELTESAPFRRRKIKLGLVGNRVRENTLIFDELDEYLEKQRAPYLTSLREAQNYVRAFTRGLGIFELPEYLAWPDWEQWDPLIEWLDSRRSRP
ncbi:MAG: ParA family protein [Pseudomonadota bacterium]